MKPALILLILLLSCSNSSYAKGDDTSAVLIYAELGIARGTHKSVKFEVNTVFAYNNIASLVCYHIFREGVNVPSNYYLDNDYRGGGRKPKDKGTYFGLMYGKMIFLARDIARLSLKAGVVYGIVITPEDFVKNNSVYSNSNYSFHFVQSSTVGLLLDPTIEFPLGRGFGLNFGGYALLAPKNASAAGLQMSISFGNVSNL